MTKSEIKLKLLCHPRVDTKSRISDDVLLHPNDKHGILPGNIIELKHPDLSQPTLFLIKSLREDFQHRDAISIEQSLAQSIKLQPYKTVSVRVVSKEDVILDLVEIVFRDQYFGRRDLLEFSNRIINTIVQRNAMLEFGVMRGYASELWRKGELTSCGYVSEHTKVVFRSSSAIYHIFIQMSREMWDFDEFGYLFFEKSVKFLRELILKSWTNAFCAHDVTLVLATRAFICAPGIKIPENSVFYKNSDGQVYADFYRVIIQMERYSYGDWKRNFSQLMLAFKRYQRDIKAFVLKNLPEVRDPSLVSIRLSTARETNLLESLNLVLSDYECYNVDRKFDQTGKACIVISPGCGVFDASRDMISFTRQRALDLGVTVDLVCLGHQPLHAIPLFLCRDLDNPENPEICIVPHWINHCFFRSSREICALNNAELVTRINVKARGVVDFKCLKRRGEVGNGEEDDEGHSTCEPPFLPTCQRRRRQTITSVVLSDSNEGSRQRTVSFNDSLLLNSAAVVERPMEGAISPSEIESYETVSPTQVWNMTVHLRSRTQSSLCSEPRSSSSSHLNGFTSEQPPWMTLYGNPHVEFALSNLLIPRNAPTLTEAPSYRRLQQHKHQDLAHSCQSVEKSFQLRDLVPRTSKVGAEISLAAVASLGGSASSWQPTGEVTGRHLLPIPVRRSTCKNFSGLEKPTAFRAFTFGIFPQIFGLNKTVSQRRWAHFHTAAQRMHLIKYDQTQCMQLLEGLRPKVNLVKVWHAYFNFYHHVMESMKEKSDSKKRGGLNNHKQHYSTQPQLEPALCQLSSVRSEVDMIQTSKALDNADSGTPVFLPRSFTDPPDNFASSAAWKALCDSVDAPDIVQTCAPISDDIISPLEVEFLKMAFLPTSNNPSVNPKSPESSSQGDGGTSTMALSPAAQYRRLLQEMLKPIGIDWKSLTTPALLPITCEYFPEPSSLLGDDFMVHEYRVVLMTISDEEWKLQFDYSTETMHLVHR